jgi:hypothetical protein
MIEAKLKRAWLWPGQTLSTDQEASAARNKFNIGDRGRFVGNCLDFSGGTRNTRIARMNTDK